VLASPLSRALDTCRLAGYGDRAEPSDALLEWDYGEYEGETTDRITRAASRLEPVARRLPGRTISVLGSERETPRCSGAGTLPSGSSVLACA
jgi:broad specificity phosphatase PhoE